MLPINIGAYYNNRLVGVVRGKKDRIINLFVDESFHGQGIGQKLVKLFEKKAKKLGSNMIKTRSSLYASVFYQKQVYKKTTGIRKFHVIKVQPLKKDIDILNYNKQYYKTLLIVFVDIFLFFC